MKNNDKLQKVINICFLLAVTIFVLGFGSALKNTIKEGKAKDLKISVLIDEVGELQGNIDVYIYELRKSLKNKNKNLEVIKKEFSKSNSQLSAMLKEKEHIISTLAQSNENLKQEISIPEHSPEILDLLIIGHNAKLTDTILLTSINPRTQKISLISIPRDFYYKGRKINELYAKYGVSELQRAVAEITGVYPEKYVIFNFQSFVDLIDELGGLEINVAKKLVDNAYPGRRKSYTTVVFQAGQQEMDGNRALKYARSRKSTSDFDRAARQQQVINAVKQKAKELDIISRLDLVTKIYAKIQANLKTNINLFEGLSYLNHYQNYSINGGNVLSTQNYLYSTRNNRGQYVLLPRGKTYSKIKKFVASIVE